MGRRRLPSGVFLVLATVLLVAGCAPELILPQNFWDRFYDAAKIGQQAQGDAWALVQAHKNRAALLDQRIGLRAMLNDPSDPSLISDLPLDLWLDEDQYTETMKQYVVAATQWNALLDTTSALIAADKNPQDWSRFSAEWNTGLAQAKAFTGLYDATRDLAARRKQEAINKATARASGKPILLDNPPPQNLPFTWFAGPLISGPFDLVDIASKLGDMWERERTNVSAALIAMKWRTVACLQDPSDSTCPSPALPASSQGGSTGGSKPSKGSSKGTP